MRWERIDVGDPGPGEVRLAQAAAGLNFIDTYHRSGFYELPLPFTPGMEGAGTVEAIGEGVSEFDIGDRVAYAGPLGAYAETRLIQADRLVKLPDAISFGQGAALMLQGMTAQMLLRQTYKIKAGQTILIHAAAGGTGLLMCQWAAALGVTVIGTVSSEAKAEVAHANGCLHPIIYTRQDFVEEVKRITEGRMLSVVYDSVGKDTFLKSLDCLHPRGMMITFGQSSGPVEPISPLVLTKKGSLYLTRPSIFQYTNTRASLNATAQDVFEAITLGQIHVSINQRYPLREASRAHEELQNRSTTGSTILTI
jgi:NADPH2:quinone reductase